MTIRKICVDEITSFTKTLPQEITCTPTCPSGTIVGVGNECQAFFLGSPQVSSDFSEIAFTLEVNLEYRYLSDKGNTLNDFCRTVVSETMDTGITGTSCCGLAPSISSSISCKAPFTWTTDSVTATITKSFDIKNLCVPTVICVEDVDCPPNP